MVTCTIFNWDTSGVCVGSRLTSQPKPGNCHRSKPCLTLGDAAVQESGLMILTGPCQISLFCSSAMREILGV